ncbi:putative mt-a70 family protein [Diplogelasinospora grovesii]|uniref:Mt-a70 family protein n=1 Tax=Diplogelasinospora grovesii TaxID=303347 RepID=A0AAN6NDQ8_9PEZI|nr:putative mt-a70 family protein [Diplogelasinospora grovesii]
MNESCILFQNDKGTVVLLDLARSIEEAQVPSRQLQDNAGPHGTLKRRLVSAKPPPITPFPTPEPKGYRGLSLPTTSASAQVAELMTLAAVESALEEIKLSYKGPWCLPRVLKPPQERGPVHRQLVEEEDGCLKEDDCSSALRTGEDDSQHVTQNSSISPSSSGQDGVVQSSVVVPSVMAATAEDPLPSAIITSPYFIPEGSHYLQGSISSQIPAFLSTAPPVFDLIVLDPPWPNRSAKRKRKARDDSPGGYHTADGLDSITRLLSEIPVSSHLSKDGGLVAVWVTNAPRFTDLLRSPTNGIFHRWGVESVGEWTWLKVTSHGEPITPLESSWRRPWERLLIARRRGSPIKQPIQNKVIISVPDVHSRKPNLRSLFENLLPTEYQALEVFARNLTAGWWAWGDQCLEFQHRKYWTTTTPGRLMMNS